jgi:hypothetical protein
MNSEFSQTEGWLYGLAFLIALGLRLVQLGALPLGDSEAASALQALGIAQRLKPALGPRGRRSRNIFLSGAVQLIFLSSAIQNWQSTGKRDKPVGNTIQF